jgi:hypothetical protein
LMKITISVLQHRCYCVWIPRTSSIPLFPMCHMPSHTDNHNTQLKSKILTQELLNLWNIWMKTVFILNKIVSACGLPGKFRMVNAWPADKSNHAWRA